MIKFAYIINITCSFAERKILNTKTLIPKFKNTQHCVFLLLIPCALEVCLKILAQKNSFKNKRSFYKFESPFSHSCHFVCLNISYTTALHWYMTITTVCVQDLEFLL